MDDHDGGWTVVGSHSSKNKRRKIEQIPDGEPSVSFLKTKPERVELKALQDLILYVLADGPGPTWMAIKNAQQFKKAVVLMVPGLDREMLQDAELWESASKQCETEKSSSGEIPSAKNDAVMKDGQHTSVDASPTDPSAEDNTAADDQQPSAKQHRLLRHILQVRAPGDSSMSRVFSPLQHMLIAPFSSKQKNKIGKDERPSQAVRTPVTAFVHSSDELHDAEYPIHPAAFTNPQDAKLEQERREQTGQSTADGWVDTNVKNTKPQPLWEVNPKPRDPIMKGLKPYALDCEMVLTSDDKYSLARVSLVDWSGKTVLDKYVKPSLPIKNYFTEFSGITEQILKNVTTTLEDIQKELLGILAEDSILLGHSLESDLNALKLTHPFVIDTSIIFPHPRGLPLRSSLKFLAYKHLKREIQKGGANGHDSVEDARAVLDLVKLKCEKGPRFGTLDANGESIFRRIGETRKLYLGEGDFVMRTSAIVEYGTPERGLGKEATFHIGCENDDEIVRGVLRAAHGDVGNGDEAEEDTLKAQGVDAEGSAVKDTELADLTIPPPGVDFIWSRLRDLEALRSWNTLPSDKIDTKSSPSPTSPSAPPTSEDSQIGKLNLAKRQTVQRVLNIYTSLPPRTLFIIYNGTNDMRPLLRLQNLHAQYKREFKVKKWDELSVKWTDTEEQEMKKECEKARRGVGILAVT